MSELVSALHGAVYEGYVKVSDAGLTGMITVRGAHKARGFGTAIKKVTGCALPDLRQMTRSGAITLAWMSPDELMVFCTYEAAPELSAALTNALAKHHALVANASDARAMFTLEGVNAAEVLAKLTPSDLRDMMTQEIRRTRVAQVAAAFWQETPERWHLICFRSTARYMFNLLSNAAQPGSEVGYS